MSETTIRAAEPCEWAEIGELTVGAYCADGYLDRNDDYADRLRDVADRAEHAEVLVAEDAAGVLLGSLTVARPESKYAEVSEPGELEFRMLAVTEQARRRGVGEALTRAVLDRARQLGCRRVVLCSGEAMRPAHRIYERIGFARMPERDWEPFPGLRLLGYGLDLTDEAVADRPVTGATAPEWSGQ